MSFSEPTPSSAIEKIDLLPDKQAYKNFTFSSCVRAGDFIFTSFQAADPSGDIERQTEQCFEYLAETIAAAGATLEDVVKVTVPIKDKADFQGMDDVYKRQFKTGYPARITAIVTGFIDEGGRAQIDTVAYKPK